MCNLGKCWLYKNQGLKQNWLIITPRTVYIVTKTARQWKNELQISSPRPRKELNSYKDRASTEELAS